MAQAITMQNESKKSTKEAPSSSQQPAPPREKVQIKSGVEDRVSHCVWHPKENTFAVAKASSLFIYTEKRRNSSNGRDAESGQRMLDAGNQSKSNQVIGPK